MARQLLFIELKESKGDKLTTSVNQGTHPNREIERARMLLLNHQGYNFNEVTNILGCSPQAFYNIVKKYKCGGIEHAIKDKPRSGRPPVYSGMERAKITALACSDEPEGYINGLYVCWQKRQ